MTAFQLDAIIGGMGDMQAEEPPVVAGNGDATFADTFIRQAVLEVEDRLLTVVATDNDRSIGSTVVLDTDCELFVTLNLLQVGTSTADDVGAGGSGIDGFLQIEPRLVNAAVTCLVVAIRSNVDGLCGSGEGLGRYPCALGDIGRVIGVNGYDIG